LRRDEHIHCWSDPHRSDAIPALFSGRPTDVGRSADHQREDNFPRRQRKKGIRLFMGRRRLPLGGGKRRRGFGAGGESEKKKKNKKNITK